MVEVSRHRRVLCSFVRDVVTVAVHSKMEWLAGFAHILLTTPLARSILLLRLVVQDVLLILSPKCSSLLDVSALNLLASECHLRTKARTGPKRREEKNTLD